MTAAQPGHNVQHRSVRQTRHARPGNVLVRAAQPGNNVQRSCGQHARHIAARSSGSPHPAVTLEGGQEPWQHPWVVRHSIHLCNSFQSLTGKPLLPGCSAQSSDEDRARALYDSSSVVVSHGVQDDPILNYGNRTALGLWEVTWEELTQMPSRLTAEPVERSDRAQLLAQAAAQGFVSDYRGIRIAKSGRRFWIEKAIIWDVLDEHGARIGQAATFGSWQFIQ